MLLTYCNVLNELLNSELLIITSCLYLLPVTDAVYIVRDKDDSHKYISEATGMRLRW